MTGARLRWRPNGGKYDNAEYRGFHLRRKAIWAKDGGIKMWKVYIGFTGIGANITPLYSVVMPADLPAVLRQAISFYELGRGEQPGGWVQTDVARFHTFQDAVDAFLDIILCANGADQAGEGDK